MENILHVWIVEFFLAQSYNGKILDIWVLILDFQLQLNLFWEIGLICPYFGSFVLLLKD